MREHICDSSYQEQPLINEEKKSDWFALWRVLDLWKSPKIYQPRDASARAVRCPWFMNPNIYMQEYASARAWPLGRSRKPSPSLTSTKSLSRLKLVCMEGEFSAYVIFLFFFSLYVIRNLVKEQERQSRLVHNHNTRWSVCNQECDAFQRETCIISPSFPANVGSHY